MDTAQQALFRVMLQDGWFTESDGDVESPTGFFGYVVNQPQDYAEVSAAFTDVIDAYGEVTGDDFAGVFVAWINSDGVITIDRVGDVGSQSSFGIPDTATVREARVWFKYESDRYSGWADLSFHLPN